MCIQRWISKRLHYKVDHDDESLSMFVSLEALKAPYFYKRNKKASLSFALLCQYKNNSDYQTFLFQ